MSSKVVDERVVEMKFDNAKFERDVAQSRASIDAFHKALNFSDSRKSLEEYQKTLKNTDASGLAGAVDTVKVKLSALNVMAMTMVQNITNSVLNSSKRIISALSFDSIKDGYNEYNLKMGSIQTIMMSTGESLKTVNDYLDELNTYSDRTIYSFSDMTQNIGKFTNAGVGLKDAVAAIKGVSNEAAISGANANEASRAMYNFAQALSAGYVKLIDWKSIENANMATVDFKQNLLDTAEALGTVKKKGDMYISTTTNAQGKTSDAFNALHNFNDELQSQWMTNEVLIKTLSKYTDETTELGKQAYAAASEFKTFSQMWDAWKESAQSGWASIWQNIFGDFDEAKQLWKWVNALIGDYIVDVYAAKNATLSAWKEGGGRFDLLEAALNVFEDVVIVLKAVKDGFQDVFPPKTSKQLLTFTKRLKEVTASFKMNEKDANNLRSTVKGLASILKIVQDIAGGGLQIAFKILGDILGVSITNVLDLTGALGEHIYKLQQMIDKYDVFGVAADGVIWTIDKGKAAFKSFTSTIGKTKIVNASLPLFKKGLEEVSDISLKVKEIGIKNFTELINKFKDGKKKVTFQDVLTAVTGFFKDVNSLLTGFVDISGKSTKATNDFQQSFQECFEHMAENASALKDSVGESLTKMITNIITLAKKIPYGNILTIILGATTIKTLWSLSKLIDTLNMGFGKLFSFPTRFGDTLITTMTKLRSALTGELKAKTVKEIAIAIALLSASLWILSKIPEAQLVKAGIALGVVSAAIVALVVAFSKLGSEGKVAESLTKTATFVAAISVSVLILVSAIKKLEGMSYEDLLPGVIAVTGLLAALTTVAYILGNNKSQFATSAAGVASIIALSVALKMMVSSLEDLLGFDYTNWPQALISLVAVVGSLIGLITIVGVANKIAGAQGLKGAAMLIGMVIALKGVVNLVDDIMKIDPKSISDNIGSFIAVFGMLGVLIAMSSAAGNNAARAGVLILGIGVGFKMIVSVMDEIGSMDPKVRKSALIAITELTAIFAALIAVSHFAGENAAKAGGLLAMAAVSISMLSVCIALLSQLDPSGLARATAAIDSMILCFTAMVAVSGLASQANKAKGTLIVLGGLIALMATSIALLSMLDQNGVKTAALAMSGIMVVFSAFLGVIALVNKFGAIGAKTIVTLGVAALVVGSLSLCMGLLAKLPVQNVIGVGDALSKVLLSVSAALVILQLVPIAGALTALASFSIFIAGLTAILAALGGLSKIPGFNDLISGGSNTLSLIGSALGGFVGSIIDGFADKATENMPTFAARLSAFMIALQPFIAGAKQLDSSIVSSMGSIVGVVLAITAANVIDGIGRFITGGSSMEQFGSELYTFGKYFAQYAGVIKGIDASAVNASASAAKALAEFAEAIPEDGGITQWITGSKSMADFAEQLIPFGVAFKEYAATVSGINPGVVVASAAAAGSLAAFANSLPDSGGLFQLLTGKKSLTDFALQLVPFGAAFKLYSLAISGIDLSVVNASTAAAKSLAAFAKDVPVDGGLAQLFTGKHSIAIFGLQLSVFGGRFKAYYNKIKGVDMSVVNASTAAAKSLASFAKEIPDTGGLKRIFAGKKSISVFGKQLSEFGGYFKSYVDDVKGIDMSAVTPSVAAAQSLAAFSNSLKGKNGLKAIWEGDADIGTFGSQLVTFGSYFAEYVEEVKGIDTTKTNAISNQLKSMIGAINEFETGSTDAVSNLASTFKSLAKISYTDAKEAFEQKEDDFNNVGEKVVRWIGAGLKETDTFKGPCEKLTKKFSSNIKSAMRDQKDTLASNFTSPIIDAMKSVNTTIAGYRTTLYSTTQSLIQNGVIKGIKSKYNAVVSSGKYLAEGLMSGVKSKNLALSDAGMSMATAVNTGLKKKAKIHSPSKLFAKNGQYIGLGLIKGAIGMLGDLKMTGISMGKALDDGVKDYLEIHSPSKKEKKNGEFSILGVIDGVRNELTNARNAGKDAGKAVDDGIKDALKGTDKTTADTVAKNTKKGLKKASKAVKKIASDTYITTKATTANAKKMIETVMDGLNGDKSYKINDKVVKSYKAMYKAYAGSVKATTKAIYENSEQAKKDKKVLNGHKKELNALYKTQKKLQKQIKKTTDTAKKGELKKSLKGVNKAISATKKQIKADTAVINKNMSKAFGVKAKNDVLDFAKALYLDSDQYKEDLKTIKQHQKSLNDLYKKKAQLENEAAKASKKSDKKTANKNLKENAKEIKAAEKQLETDQKNVQKHIKATLKTYRDGIRDTLRDYMKISNVALDTGINAFEEFNNEIDLSTAKLISNMQSQITGIKSIESGLNDMAERGFASGLIEKLRSMGVEAAGYIKVFRKMGTDEIKQTNDAWDAQTRMTKETLMRNWQLKQADAIKWKKGIIKLLNMGYDTDLMTEIQNMGIDSGMAYINALLDAGEAGRDEINKTYRETLSISDSAADDIVASWAKNGKKAGKKTGKLVTELAKDTGKKVADATKEVEEPLSKAAKAIQTKITQASEALQEEYKKIEKVSEELATTVKSNIESFMSITNLSMDTGISDLFSEFEVEQWDYTLDMFIDNMQSQVDGVKYVSDGLDELARLGFCDGFIDYLKNLGPQAAQYITEFRTATQDQIDRTNDVFDQYSKLTKEKLLQSAKDTYATVKHWGEMMNVLASSNLNKEIYAELAEAGPSNSEMVEAYFSMSDGERDQINQYYEERLKISDEVSKSISDSYKDKAKESAKSYYDTLIAGLQSELETQKAKDKQTKKLTSIASKLGDTITTAISASLGDKKSSAALTSAGKSLVSALDTGVKSKKTDAEKAGKSVAKAASKGAASVDTTSANSAGASLGSALASGIRSSKSSATSAAQDLVDSVNAIFSTISAPDVGAATSGSSGKKTGTGTIKSIPKSNTTKKSASNAASSVKNVGNNLAGVISGVLSGKLAGSSINTYNFNQTNNSPKALSSAEIYRNSKNLFSQAKGALS